MSGDLGRNATFQSDHHDVMDKYRPLIQHVLLNDDRFLALLRLHLIVESKKANESRKKCHHRRDKCVSTATPRACQQRHATPRSRKGISWIKKPVGLRGMCDCPMEGCHYRLRDPPSYPVICSQVMLRHQLDSHFIELGLKKDILQKWRGELINIDD